MDPLKYEELLKEFDEHRAAIKVMVKDLEEIKKNIDRLFPNVLEARYMRFFEEKVKSTTGLFNTLLEMRKEIARSVREEIEIRRKVDKADSDYDIDEILDIRDLADKLDDFKKAQKKVRDNLPRKDLKDYEDISIPGVTERIQQ